MASLISVTVDICRIPTALPDPGQSGLRPQPTRQTASRKNFLFRFRSAAVAGRNPWARKIASASFTVIRPAALTGTRTMTGASMLQVELDVALIIYPQISHRAAEGVSLA